jgi:hypothetical protein
LEGSEKVNRDPFEESLSMHVEALREAARNDAAKSLWELAQKDPNGWGQMMQRVPKGYKPKAGEGVVGFYENGNLNIYRVPDFVADAANLAERGDVMLVGGALLSASRTVFQKGTTLANLAFAVPNAIRDFTDMSLLSKAGAKGPLDFARMLTVEWTKSFYESLTNAPTRREFLRSGAAFSTMQKNIDPEYFQGAKRGPGGNLVRGHLIRSIEQLNNAVEEATKLTAYKRLRKQGMSVSDAAWETRNWGGSPDFGHRGAKIDSVNLLVMFFNANEKGLTRTLSRLKDPKRLLPILAGFTLGAMALDNHNAQFTREDGSLEDDHISDTDRHNYFYIIRPEVYQTSQGELKHRVWKLPKGHVARLLFNPIQDVVRQGRSKELEGTQTMLDVISNVLPGQFNLQRGQIGEGLVRGTVASLNPMMREPAEQMMNFDTFRGTPIVPRRLQEVSPGEQFVPTTSVTAREISDATGNIVSPMRIEHGIKGFTGGLGEQFLNLADTAQGQATKVGEIELEGDERISNLPGVGPITRRFVGSIQDQVEKDMEEKFYDMAGKSRTANNDFNKIMQTEPDRAVKFGLENQKLIGGFSTISEAQESLSQLRNLKQRIMQDKGMPDAQKKAQIRQLRQLELLVLKTQLEFVKPIVQPEQ